MEVYKLYFHSALCSIERNYAAYLCERENWIEKQYKSTYCPEESIIGTVIMSSKYKETLCNKDIRLIDWKRNVGGGSSPHTFKYDDVDKKMLEDARQVCSKMFARKFCDEEIEIAEFVYDMVKGKESRLDNNTTC